MTVFSNVPVACNLHFCQNKPFRLTIDKMKSIRTNREELYTLAEKSFSSRLDMVANISEDNSKVVPDKFIVVQV